MYRMRRGWRFAAAATAAAMLVLVSGCAGGNLSMIYNLVTLVLDALSTAATSSA